MAMLASRTQGKKVSLASISGPKRAAMLMLALGEEYGGKIWNMLDDDEIRQISLVMSQLGTVDATDGGDSYRYSGSFDWQRTRNNASTKVSAYGLAYDLNLYSNFTYFLDDPDNGDQFRQADHRFVSGAKVTTPRGLPRAASGPAR